MRIFLVIGLLILSLAVQSTHSQPTENVLIGYNGEANVSVLNTYREYSYIDVVGATLTQSEIEELANDPDIRFIETDGPVYALGQEIPWGIERVFDGDYNGQGSGVAVAILDTGIAEHEDLIIAGGINIIDSGSYYDGNGHGTHVAGTVAALDNDIGVIGVTPGTDIYAVKVLGDNGRGTWSDVVAGIEWAIEQDIPIINMSLGGGHSEALKEVCNFAYEEGILIIAAAGNSGNASGNGDNVLYPAKYESVIAVAASDWSDNRASFSSTGPAVELIAPGVGVRSAWLWDSYINLNGTSMAAPHVAGVAALVWADNRNASNTDIREILQDTAEDLGLPAEHQGFGLVRPELGPGWEKITSTGATSIDYEDGVIVASSPDHGVWIYSGEWENVTRSPAYAVAYSDGRLAVSLDTGIWFYEAGEWECVTTAVAHTLAYDGDVLVAASPDRGIWILE